MPDNPLPQERCAYPLGIAHDASFHECELPKGHNGHHAFLPTPEARVEQDPTSDEALVAELRIPYSRIDLERMMREDGES